LSLPSLKKKTLALNKNMLIGIAGPKNSGKNTCAAHLSRYFPSSVVHAFAEPVKRVCQQLYLLSEEQLYDVVAKETVDTRWGLTPRQMFQRVGTDYVRNQLDPEFWTKHFEFWWSKQRQQNPDTVILVPDVRFQNEVDLIQRLGGKVVYVYRPFVHNMDLHESETGAMELQNTDYTINNCGSLGQLYQQIDYFMERL
jgi:energy-coupling factor transporter ATP-binding protein EcfA2